MEPTFRFSTPDLYRFFLEMGPLPNANRYFQGKNEFWKQSMAHGTYDEYWKPRGMEQHLKGRSGPAVLVVGGWFDAEDLYGALKTYAALAKGSPRIKSHLVMGPWTHGQWGGGSGERIGGIEFGGKTGDWYRENVILPFFEHHLRDAADPKLAKAIVFETGSNRWHSFPSWPPKLPASGVQQWCLAPKGRLLPWSGDAAAPKRAAVKGNEAYVSDPRRPVPFVGERVGRVPSTYMVADQRFAWERPDVLSYELGPWEEDVTLAGPIMADLNVAISSTDADFVVKVIDVYPDDARSNTQTDPPTRLGGYQMLLRAEIMRGKFRDSLEKPKPFVPNRPARVRFELNDVFHTLPKGHRLMVQVQSSWFPLADLNPQVFTDIYRAKASQFKPATIRLLYDSGRAPGSRIRLPFVKLPAESAG
jgi:putative CocE/NonD family hydrolase